MKKISIHITKKIAGLTAGLLAGLTVISCSDKLDLQPVSSFTADTYYQTVSEVNTAVLGVYADLASGNLYGSNFMPIVGDNDQSHFGNRAGDDGDISRYTIATTNTYLPSYLTTLYNGVQRANLILQKIPKMSQYSSGTVTEKGNLRRYYGEALALRALFYFDLIRLFGDVPYTTQYPSASDNSHLPRTSRDTIYEHIIADMDTAVKYLPWQSAISNYEVERISKNAAFGLAARICLSAAGYSLRWDLKTGSGPSTMALRADSATRVPQLYQKAMNLCDSVILRGYNNLNNSYTQVFKDYCQDLYYPQESMFEIGFYYSASITNVSGRIGTANCFTINGSSKYKAGNNYLKCLPTYYFSFDPNDTRRKLAGTWEQIDATSARKGQVLGEIGIAKWRRDWCLSGTQIDNNQTGINWVMLRYSDILLMYAEASNYVNKGATGKAVQCFESVRKRAFGVAPYGSKPASLIGTTPTDYAGFFTAIVNERSWELGHEGWRKQDLIRWNLLASKIAETQLKLYNLTTAQGEFASQPAKMYYKYDVAQDTIGFSTTTFGTSTTSFPTGSSNWVTDLNPTFGASGYTPPASFSVMQAGRTTYKFGYFAYGFVHNKSEILPMPQTVIDSDPAITQCPAYLSN
ncbi:MAG: RagB/SusD family nutrient uptake outer membrane protein [Bacteroidota bacterium]|nr:RagB/SusD family nutrient uptake outer membrane protein [Bacteroidota bacterium]